MFRGVRDCGVRNRLIIVEVVVARSSLSAGFVSDLLILIAY